MENKEEKETFQYTYSAAQQAEIKAIRKKYAAHEEDKMELLRRLDTGVTQKATVYSLVIGIIGALLLGVGMSLTMSDLAGMLGLSQSTALCIGAPVGVVGIALICLAYPAYNRIMKKEREKIAPEILRLTDELMK